MPSFDLHQHLWPEPFVSVLAKRAEPPRLRDAVLETVEGVFPARLEAHDLDRRLTALDDDGTDVAVVSLAPTLGLDELRDAEREALVSAYDAGMQELVERSGGRLRAFSADGVRDGFAGVCWSARRVVAHLFDEGDAPVFDELERRGLVLFVHPGPARPAPGRPSWWVPVVDYTAEMQTAYAAWLARGVAAYPKLRVVFAILAGGAPIQLERLRSRGVELRSTLHPNLFFDVASYGRRALELSLATFGVRQLVYGSDVPVIDSRATADALAGFGEAVVGAVRKENPSLLLG